MPPALLEAINVTVVLLLNNRANGDVASALPLLSFGPTFTYAPLEGLEDVTVNVCVTVGA